MEVESQVEQSQGTKRCQAEDGNQDLPKRTVPEWAESHTALLKHLAAEMEGQRAEVMNYIKVVEPDYPLQGRVLQAVSSMLRYTDQSRDKPWDATGMAVVHVEKKGDCFTTMYMLGETVFTENGYDMIWDVRNLSDAWDPLRKLNLKKWTRVCTSRVLCQVTNPSFVYFFSYNE